MAYLLKHKDINVALLVINEEGNVVTVKDVFQPEHLPLSCFTEDGKINSKRLSQWWDERGIPASREYYKAVMAEIGVTGKNRLLLECNGLSLTDHYWIINENESKNWKNVNFLRLKRKGLRKLLGCWKNGFRLFGKWRGNVVKKISFSCGSW